MPDITTLFEGTDGATRENFNQKLSDVNAHGNDTSAHITTATHTRTGTTNNLDIPTGAKNLTFLATADLADGDTWTVNGASVTAVLQTGDALPGGLFKNGCWVTGVRLSDDGTQLFFRAGASTVPSIFGNGSDGDAVISGTVTLPVPVPHQSIIEKHYKSLYINAGAILRAAAHNAGLIIRVQGDCIIHGTIDQSGLAPKTNLDNNYPYPTQLICGDGGAGGNGSGTGTRGSGGIGGSGMPKRSYGGGYGGGGGGCGGDNDRDTSTVNGGDGGTGNVYITTSTIFIGGSGGIGRSNGTAGSYGGGGGGGGGSTSSGTNGDGASGATGAGSSGTNATALYVDSGGGGGAGNYGGGVILLFVGGDLIIDGSIKANGLNGGAAGSSSLKGRKAGQGGGGGGGAIYMLHRGTYTNTGLLQVNGGTGAQSGGVGSITVIQHTN